LFDSDSSASIIVGTSSLLAKIQHPVFTVQSRRAWYKIPMNYDVR